MKMTKKRMMKQNNKQLQMKTKNKNKKRNVDYSLAYLLF